MSSEEEDYMSDAFLNKSITEVRPGLIHNRSRQRELDFECKRQKLNEEHRRCNKSVKQLEQENRDEGLASALPSSNKGFAMLAKMGYQAGGGIGKSASGITKPIDIQIKVDRGGLGREAALNDLHKHRKEIRQRRMADSKQMDRTTVTTEEFRRRIQQKADEKRIEIDLSKCQRVCERLDAKAEIASPAMEWFWPPPQPPQRNVSETEESDEVEETATIVADEDSNEEDADDEVEYESSEKIEMIIDYLRTTYCYCHWCGTAYTDLNDMKDNCPGPNKDDH